MGSRFGVLALSGGGFLGLYTLAILAALEKEFGTPIATRFDLLAGTSVGGIIALGLAAEIPVREIQYAFEKNGTKIFSDRAAATGRLRPFLELRRNALRPKYQAEELRRTIIELLGHDKLIGDLKHPVIVPAVNVTKGCPQIFKTPHHETFSVDLHYRVVDVALATSAAHLFPGRRNQQLAIR